jgi:hypothetical protein
MSDELKIDLKRLLTDDELVTYIFLPQPNKDYTFKFNEDGRRDLSINLNLTSVLVCQDIKSSYLCDRDWLNKITDRIIELGKLMKDCTNKNQSKQIAWGITELNKLIKDMGKEI